ncbi:cinnamoyl-CoA reductase 1-like [Setaria viridis]|uniref:cinnamoyl-CoA reductase 1-like n=1 Tax=Setaria viridis TaxID=4556 RepID=UPI0014938607|nr:uncharacterized protein LOC117864760 [Setaria viridis]
MVPNPNWPTNKVVDEDCWADIKLLKKVQRIGLRWEGGIAMAVLNPGIVLGPMSVTSLDARGHVVLLSSDELELCNEYNVWDGTGYKKYLGEKRDQTTQAKKLDLDDIYIGCVDVRDIAHSLMVLYDNSSAQGRHLCLESIERFVDFTNSIADLYPEHPVHR